MSWVKYRYAPSTDSEREPTLADEVRSGPYMPPAPVQPSSPRVQASAFESSESDVLSTVRVSVQLPLLPSNAAEAANSNDGRLVDDAAF